jgi:hypothetical protein
MTLSSSRNDEWTKMVTMSGSWYGKDEAVSEVYSVMIQARANESTMRQACSLVMHTGQVTWTWMSLRSAPVRDCLGVYLYCDWTSVWC